MKLSLKILKIFFNTLQILKRKFDHHSLTLAIIHLVKFYNGVHLLSILCTDHTEMKTCMHFCQCIVHYSDTKYIHLLYN